MLPLSLKVLNAYGCKSLRTLSSSIQNHNLSQIKWNFGECGKLDLDMCSMLFNKAWVAFCRTPSKPDYKVDRKPHISKFVRQLQSNFLNNASFFFFFFFFFSSSSRGSSRHIFAKSANDIMVPSRTWTKSNSR
ncbi:hypothetical protein LINPERHAP1_LOCUS1258 [Linum perenne]